MTSVRFAMVGGGGGAFIGPIHRMAAALSGNCELVAGAFSRDAHNSQATGVQLGLDPHRCHAGWETLLSDEAARPEGQRAQFVAIVAPNAVHAPAAIAAMEAGFDVLLEKPLADGLSAARAIAQAAQRTGRLVGVTHPYIAYPMALQARAMVAKGELGAVRRVAVSYIQGWLGASEDEGGKQAAWRLDPAQAGPAGAFGDIGSHAFNLVETLTGETIVRLSADLRATLEGRRLDDDGAALFALSGGGKGTLIASQVCAGEANGLSIAIWGEKASLHWAQQEPNALRLLSRGKPEQVWRAGSDQAWLEEAVRTGCRTPGGHPEGFIEAFANIYRDFSDTVAGRTVAMPAFAPIEAGLRCMAFVDAAIASSSADGRWHWVAVHNG
ncbi:Gfo/Idh/MocA family protein [Novosphingobium organovorum]|nr:Gfo/Idh/MocA family oxidoreductase [Novosphingobium organovorum]